MKLIAVRAMLYDGVRYEVGDEISPSLIPDRKLRTLINGRFVKSVDNGETVAIPNDVASVAFDVFYVKNGTEVKVPLSQEQLTLVFKVLQSNVVDVDKILKELDGQSDLVEFISSVEKRTTVIAKIDKRFHKE
jgi:hypothetical protein